MRSRQSKEQRAFIRLDRRWSLRGRQSDILTADWGVCAHAQAKKFNFGCQKNVEVSLRETAVTPGSSATLGQCDAEPCGQNSS